MLSGAHLCRQTAADIPAARTFSQHRKDLQQHPYPVEKQAYKYERYFILFGKKRGLVNKDKPQAVIRNGKTLFAREEVNRPRYYGALAMTTATPRKNVTWK